MLIDIFGQSNERNEINEKTRKEAEMLFFFFIKIYDKILCIIQSPCVESLVDLSPIDIAHLPYCSVFLYHVP